MDVAFASFCDQIRDRTVSRGQATALIEPSRCSLSYTQLWTMVEALAGQLRAAGITSDDTLALVHPDGICGIVSLLTATGICASSTMNPALTAAEFEAELLELGATAIIVDAECQVAIAAAGELSLLIIESKLTPTGCEWMLRDRNLPTKISATRRRNHNGALILLHTSATTGRRKVVPISSINLQSMLDNTQSILHLTADDRLLVMAKLFHVQGVISPLVQLLAGGSVIATGNFAPKLFSKWVEDYRPTWFACGPTLHRALLEQLRQNPLPATTSLRFARSGGSPLPPELHTQLEAALNIPVLDVYGLTETGGVTSTTLGNNRHAVFRPGSVGKSMGPELAIMSADGSLLDRGQEGEIVVSGPSVISGYLYDPEANAEAFRHGWFRTGDLGHLDTDGFLYVTGRIKEIINRGGQKVIPTEVDAVLRAHPSVREVATFAVPHPTLGEDVASAVVLNTEAAMDESQLREFAAQRLARFKVPRYIFKLDAIPYGATGKPQRLVLRQMFIDGVFAPPTSAQPGSPSTATASQQRVPYDLPQCLSEIWARSLNVEVTSPTQDFFALGGDSLTAATMLSEVETHFGLNIELAKAAFFDRPTIEGLVPMVTAAMGGKNTDSLPGEVKVVPVRTGRRQTLFLMPADGEEGLRFRRLAKYLDQECGLSILRPGNTWHEQSVSAIEDAGHRSAAAVRAAQPNGPYYLGGYCYGGVVAFAAACELERQGHSASVVLFDVPTPGTPHILRDWRIYRQATTQRLRRSINERNPRPLASLGGRALWFALRKARPRKGGLWATPPMRWICKTVQTGYFSFHYPGSFNGPVLHLLASEDDDILFRQSCHGWLHHVASALAEESFPGNHDTLFNEPHLPALAQAVAVWVAKLSL